MIRVHLAGPSFLLLFVALSLGEERPTIETSLGKISGSFKKSYSDRKYAAYEGIPYAKPPIGDLRFEEPIEAEPWSGILDATLTHTCLQMSWITRTPIGSEDCLYLNVYVPVGETASESNLDVLVHIHGGAFMIGDPELAGPLHLMDRDVIYVSMNYRVGVLGFLSTEDDVVPGNNGMKDQVLALRWVQKYIEKFGGNPNSVTIIGLSAGGSAVHLHYFSPISKGLFQRGISQGGTALVPWALSEEPLKIAKRLAGTIGCDFSSTREMVKCLKERSGKQVVQNVHESSMHGFPLAPFSPVIENQRTGAFLTDHPYKMLNSGNITDVPWINGGTADEGIMGIELLNFNYDILNRHWETFLPYALDYNYTVNEEDKAIVAQKIKSFYLDNKNISEDNVSALIKLFSDRLFHMAFEKSSRLHAKVAKSPVYSYIYGYKKDVKMQPPWNLQKDYGVDHASDGILLYQMKYGGNVILENNLSESDKKISQFLLDVVTSFAKDGKPVAKGIIWEPVGNGTDFNYLRIDNDKINMNSTKEISPMEFWESLPIKEYDNLLFNKD